MHAEHTDDMLFSPGSSQSLSDDMEGSSGSERDMLDEELDADFDFDSCGFYEDTGEFSPQSSTDHDADMLDCADGADGDDIDGSLRAVRDRDWVIARVEALLERIVDGLLAEDAELCITLQTRAGMSRRNNSTSSQDGALPLPKTRNISFPAVLLRILEIVHECLISGVVATKRDIYYRHPDLFIKQSTVDRYVDDLACTFGVPRWMLNVTAAAKGLIAGNFTLSRCDGTTLCGLSEEGMLVPKIQESDALDLSSIRWTVVIEKEATFRTIVCSPQWKTLGTQGIIVTAKGYPDLDSRKLLRQIADRSPNTPMYALVDFDPDGVAILSTYKHGSYRLAHENTTPSGTPGLDLPQLRWLGVQSHQICRTPVNECATGHSTTFDAQGLMRLTSRDRIKARRMLDWDLCAEDGPEATWRCELQTMLMLNVKAEMQILEERAGGLVSWLESELGQGKGELAEHEK